MIALDSNVLVRFLVEDDPAQAAIARHLIEGVLTPEEPGFVSLPVIFELIWLLRTTYRHEPEKIRHALGLLLEIPQLAVEQEAVVKAALDSEAAAIADAMIHELGRSHGCSRTVTFDRGFARLNGVELLTARGV